MKFIKTTFKIALLLSILVSVLLLAAQKLGALPQNSKVNQALDKADSKNTLICLGDTSSAQETDDNSCLFVGCSGFF